MAHEHGLDDMDGVIVVEGGVADGVRGGIGDLAVAAGRIGRGELPVEDGISGR
jgi:hypothetical protein